MLLLGRYAFVPATRRTALYLIGAMASFWSLTRMAAILS